MKHSFITGNWYEIVYSNSPSVYFKFLGNIPSGNIQGILCNGKKSEILLDKPYKDIIDHGVNSPCK